MIIRAAQDTDKAALGRLCWAYRDLLVARAKRFPGIVETYYAKDDYARLIEDLPRIHARPKGDILLAETEDGVVGCGMYYPLDQSGLCEIKRVFVTAEARGRGAARALFQDAMARAKADGHTRMVLDTMVELKEAIALYAALGFTPADPFYEVDPRFREAILFFGKDL